MTFKRALLRAGHVREVLGCSRREMDKLVAAGVLTPVRLKPGMMPYYRQDEVRALLEAVGAGDGERNAEKLKI